MFDSPLMRGLRRFPALVCALLLFTVAEASAQQFIRLWPNGEGGTIDADAETVSVENARSMATVGIQVFGSFTGTLTPQCTVNGRDWVAVPVGAIATPSDTATTITSAGVYVGNVAGCRSIRVLSSSWSMGSAEVELNTVQVPLASSASVSLESAELSVGAQPQDDPHYVRCSNGTTASPCLVTGSGTAGTAASGVVTVQGIASMTPVVVSATNLDVQIGGSDTVTVTGTVTANLSATDNAVLDDIADGITVTATNLDVQSGGADLATAAAQTTANASLATIAGDTTDIETSVEALDNVLAPVAPNTATATATLAVGAQYNLTPPTFTDGQQGSLQLNSSGALIVTGGGGGTEYVVNAAAPANPTGNAPVAERDDALSALSEVEGDWTNLRTNANGALWTAVDGTVTTSGTVTSISAGDNNIGNVDIASIAAGDNNIGNVDIASAIPAGTNNIGDVDVASIAAGNNNIGDVDVASIAAGDNDIGNVDLEYAGVAAATGNGTASGSLRVTLASDSTGVLAATQSGTWNVGTVTTVTGVTTVSTVTNLATIGTSVTPGTSAAHLGKAEDAAHASGDTGVAILARRSDTAASSGGTDGDYSTLNTDSLGRLWVNPFPASPAAGTYLTVRLSDGSNFFSPVTPYTHDTALGTITSVTGPMTVGRASAAAPSNVSADDDAVAAWFLRNGSQVVNLAAGGTLITATSSSLNVNCTGGCSGGAQYAEDAAHSSGDSFTMAGAVRRDTTPSSSSGTAGDVSALNVDANGRLYTQSVLYNSSGTELTPAVDYTHDTALGTITSVTGPAGMCRASQAAPSDVSADNDAVLLWCLRNGSPVMNLAGGGTLISAGSGGASAALRVVIATDDPVNDAQVKLDANMVAHDAADAGNPLKVGFKATSSVTGQTPVANNDRTDAYAGLDGILITRPHANLEDRVSAVVGVTDGSSTSLVAAQGSGVRFCATTVIVSNSSATNVTVDLRDGTGGSVIATIPAAADMGGAVIPLGVPLCTSANTAMAMDPSAAASTVTVTAIGFKTEL